MATVAVRAKDKELREIDRAQVLGRLYEEKKARRPLFLYCTSPDCVRNKKRRKEIEDEFHRIFESCERTLKFGIIFADPMRLDWGKVIYVEPVYVEVEPSVLRDIRFFS